MRNLILSVIYVINKFTGLELIFLIFSNFISTTKEIFIYKLLISLFLKILWKILKIIFISIEIIVLLRINSLFQKDYKIFVYFPNLSSLLPNNIKFKIYLILIFIIF